MVVKRIIDGNPVEIKLSQEELLDAWGEQEFENDMDDVKCFLDEFVEDKTDFAQRHGFTFEQAEEYIGFLAHKKSRYESEGANWIDAVEWALVDLRDSGLIKKNEEV